jgi:hypothetical protein
VAKAQQKGCGAINNNNNNNNNNNVSSNIKRNKKWKARQRNATLEQFPISLIQNSKEMTTFSRSTQQNYMIRRSVHDVTPDDVGPNIFEYMKKELVCLCQQC